ncbi:MAG: aromatic ring-hydroxylating dioxygenase subunit alpha [Rhodobacteraceae bacterium]|nr:aromatic ring-hydroxylating dioxygenase subunit alpha [Paracoccaceae bacterium]
MTNANERQAAQSNGGHTARPHADRAGLPAWSYFSAELLEAEKDALFRRHWQVICHASDIPAPGDFITCDIVGDRALILRDGQGAIRAFHNLCRHRGSRVLGDERGNCRNSIVCPFHGWVYNLDGTLRQAAQPGSLPDLDPVEWGLKPLESEVWNGFVFVRFQPGPQPPVAALMARWEAELSQYRLDRLLPDGKGVWSDEVRVNWKCIRDVDNEGYHVPMAHPGLDDLFGRNYFDEPFREGTARSYSRFRPGDGRLWSVRNYKKILPEVDGLDADHRRAWLYLGVFPNFVFGIYPDSVIFYQEFPVEVGRTIQRGACYRRPDEDRRLRAARYLSGRIDRITSREDEMLTQWTWEAAFSSAYDGVILSDLETGVKSYHDALRGVFPVLTGPEPAPGTLLARNAALCDAATAN